MAKIYLASSWKRKETVSVMHDILVKRGHEADSFCRTDSKRVSFNWDELVEIMYNEGIDIRSANAIRMVDHWRVKEAFKEDKKYIDWADTLIMLMPCGRSAHLEAGYAAGTGKKLYIIGGFEPGEFEVMYGFGDGMYEYNDIHKLLETLELDDRWRDK